MKKITTINYKELWDIKNRLVARKELVQYKLRQKLVELNELDIDDIVKKFSFKSMQKDCIDFCAMFNKEKPCHEQCIDEFYCYGCYCPNYQPEISFDDKTELYKVGKCLINSKFGFYKETTTKCEAKKPYLILNCVNCTVPHNRAFVKKLILKDLDKLV